MLSLSLTRLFVLSWEHRSYLKYENNNSRCIGDHEDTWPWRMLTSRSSEGHFFLPMYHVMGPWATGTTGAPMASVIVECCLRRDLTSWLNWMQSCKAVLVSCLFSHSYRHKLSFCLGLRVGRQVCPQPHSHKTKELECQQCMRQGDKVKMWSLRSYLRLVTKGLAAHTWSF